MFITALERRAARQRGVEKPWLYDSRPLAECPVCAEKIKHGVAVCRSCGAILDREKAAQYGLVGARRRERQKDSENPSEAAKQEIEAGKEKLRGESRFGKQKGRRFLAAQKQHVLDAPGRQ